MPVDGSEQSFSAASFAVSIAKKYGSEIKLLHVVTINQSLRAVGMYGMSYSDAVEKQIPEAKKETGEWFGRITDETQKEGVRTGSQVADSPISIIGEIVDYAEKDKSDMIVMGTKGKSGFARLLLGSGNGRYYICFMSRPRRALMSITQKYFVMVYSTWQRKDKTSQSLLTARIR